MWVFPHLDNSPLLSLKKQAYQRFHLNFSLLSPALNLYLNCLPGNYWGVKKHARLFSLEGSKMCVYFVVGITRFCENRNPSLFCVKNIFHENPTFLSSVSLSSGHLSPIQHLDSGHACHDVMFVLACTYIPLFSRDSVRGRNCFKKSNFTPTSDPKFRRDACLQNPWQPSIQPKDKKKILLPKKSCKNWVPGKIKSFCFAS